MKAARRSMRRRFRGASGFASSGAAGAAPSPLARAPLRWSLDPLRALTRVSRPPGTSTIIEAEAA